MFSSEVLNSEEKGQQRTGEVDQDYDNNPSVKAPKEGSSYVYGTSSLAMWQIIFDSVTYGYLLVWLS
jgi:hypothetical protein